MLSLLAAFVLCFLISGIAAAETVHLAADIVADGLVSPVTAVSPDDGSGRLFVVDQIGLIRIIDRNGTLQSDPFLDVRDRLVDLQGSYDERGLLALAFHPDYRNNGRFFVKYSEPLRQGAPEEWDHTLVIAEFRVDPSDPNRADPNSEQKIMEVDKPQSNHNGGAIAFGPDGYLYITLGDGGGANDTGEGHDPNTGNGQDIDTLLGKILRIDVDTNDGRGYGIPPSNPFVGRDGRDEIYAYGFRNPYTMSFDMGGSGELFVGDAGQNLWEEIDIVQNGHNYGWNLKEGSHCFDPQNPDDPPRDCNDTGYRGEPLTPPIVEVSNLANPAGGRFRTLAIIGGYVYRGQDVPSLQGRYIFGGLSSSESFADGRVWMAERQESRAGWRVDELMVEPTWPTEETARATRLGYVKGFGQDDLGEVYVMLSDSIGPAGTTGKVVRLTMAGEGDAMQQQTPTILSQSSGNRGPFSVSIGRGNPASVRFHLDTRATVAAQVIDVAGRVVRDLGNRALVEGDHELGWDGRDDSGSLLPSGVYFYRLESDLGRKTQRVLYVR
ncbi:MAG: PQQ-dependent sugar dehydrogenase [Candidatus Eisenbacteria bacterium]